MVKILSHLELFKHLNTEGSFSEDIQIKDSLVDKIKLFFLNINRVCDSVIEGNNCTIKGLAYPLFEEVNQDGLVQNLTIESNFEQENKTFGSICRINNGKLENITFNGHIDLEDSGKVVGGITGIEMDRVEHELKNDTACCRKRRVYELQDGEFIQVSELDLEYFN